MAAEFAPTGNFLHSVDKIGSSKDVSEMLETPYDEGSDRMGFSWGSNQVVKFKDYFRKLQGYAPSSPTDSLVLSMYGIWSLI